MMTEKLFTVLSSIHLIRPEFRTAIEQSLTALSLPKDHLLLEATKVAECVYFLEEGFAMSYTFVKGKKQVECFWHSGQIMVSARSFFEQVPSQEFIQLRAPCELLCMSYPRIHHLFEVFPEAHVIYRVIMNQYYEHSRERTRDLQHLTAVERYEKLIQHYPNIEQHLTQHELASYLGIAPQSFSRLKKRQRGR